MKKKFTFLIMAMLFAILGSGAEAWGQTRDDLNLTFDLSKNPGGWPTTSSTTLTNYTYTLNGTDYTFALKNVKCNSGYLMLTSTAVLGLPAIENYKLTKVVAKNSGGCSTTTKVGISSSSSSASYISGGEIQTWSTTSSSYTYNLTGTEANTMYYMYVTNKNAQVVELTLTYESTSASTVAAPTFNPAANTYYEDQTIELSAEDGCAIYYTLDGSTPDNESTLYGDAIQLTVPSTTTIKAIAVDGEGNSSNVASATYSLMRTQYTPEQLLAEVEPTSSGVEATVVFNNHEITGIFVTQSGYRNGIYLDIEGDEDFYVYCRDVPETWEVGGKVSGNIIGDWTLYNSTKEFCPEDWEGFSYSKTTQLPAPTGLTVSDLSMTGATLSWNAVENASSYTVYVTDLDAYENTIEGIETTSVVLNDLTAGTEYMWTVQAIGNEVTYLNSGIADGEVFETPTTVLYNVTIAPADGGTIKAQIDGEDITQAANGATVSLVANPNTHFTFTSWNVYRTDEPHTTVTVTDNAFTMPAYDVTVTATFTEEAKYTVTYAKGGDDVEGDVPAEANYYAGETVEVAANPFSYVGHAFDGWSFNPSVEIVTIDDVDYFEMPASNVTVTATWAEKAQYTVTYMSLGAQIGTEQVYDGDLCANVPEVTNTPTGWTFLGWTTGSADNTTTAPEPFDLTTSITSATTLNAVFTKTEGETSWDETALADLTSSDVFVMVGSNEKFLQNNSTTAVDADIEDGQVTTTIIDAYKWNVTEEDGSYVFNANGSTNVLYFTNDNNGVKFGTPQNQNASSKYFIQNDNNYLVGTDGTNTRYLSYYVNGSNWRCYKNTENNPIAMKFYKLNAGTTYYTTIAPAAEYTIAIDGSIEHGTVEVEGEITSAIAGTEITLVVTPDQHYSLTANSLTVTGESLATVKVTPVPGEVIKYTFVMPAEAVTITAQFTENPKFTVSCYANGTSVSTEKVYAGVMQLPVSVTAPNGYTFVGWTNQHISGVAESATYFSSYNVTEDVDLYAVFAIAETGGTTSVTKDIIAEAGITASVTLNETAYQIGNLPIQLTATKGTSNWPVINYNANNGTDLRFYKSSSSVTFATTNNSTITKIEFKKNESKASDLKTYFSVNVGTLSANVWTGSANSVTISFSNNDNFKEQMYIINVTYSETSAPTYSNFCTTVTPITEDKTISGNATWEGNYTINGHIITIGSGAVLTVNGALGNTNPANLIIEDGAQLILNEKNIGVMATVKKQIEASNTPTGEPVDKWYTIGSPVKEPIINGSTGNYVADIIPVGGMSALTYDLYYLDMTAGTWINYRQEGDTPGFTTLENGRGYIYSNQSATTVKYVGELNTANVNRSVNTGWNLVSNPFAQTIAFSNFELDNSDPMVGYYSLDGAGGWQAEPITTDVASNTGILVNVPEGASSIKISKPAEAIENNGAKRGDSNDNAYAYIEINVANANYSDRAYAAFAEGYGLPKYDHINAEIQKVYIPQGGEDFAIAMMDESVTLFPVSFKAMTTGYYTISLKSSQIYEGYNDFDYLHLIDNMTGEETDMLVEDGYEFVGSPRDNAGRFTVKLHRNGIEENDIEDANFVYQNGNELVINGEGTFQLIDMLGRVVISKEVHGETVNVGSLNTGAYIVRMIGNEVKTQKIVIK